MINAVLTGSRAYGTPREDSDLDLVVLADSDAIKALVEAALASEDGSGGDSPTGATLRFGRLNLIVETSRRKFEAWRVGTLALKAIAPVTREQAVAVFKRLFNDAAGGVPVEEE